MEFVIESVVTAKGVANRVKVNQLDASQGSEVPVVKEFIDVFPKELPGVPPDRDIEFMIELKSGTCHTRFLCQNRVLIVCMIQDQLFHTYSQKCSQITKCHNIEYNYYINNVFND
jgi:hypothetical protein